MSIITIKRTDAIKKTIVLYLTIAFIIGAIVPSVSSDPADPWWNTDWHYRKEIKINHTKVASDLTDFPVLIKVVDSNLSLKAQADGDDITFTNKQGLKLNHEIEYYNSTTGELVTWVKVPLLSSSQNTILYLYYGNQYCSNQQNRTNTWDANFLSIHHLDEAAGTIFDSTSHYNDGTPYGNPNQDVTGKIDGADSFDGINDHFTLPQVYSTESQFTLDAWIYPQTGARYFISQWNNYKGVFLQVGANADRIEWYIDSTAGSITGITLNTWYHIVLTYDGSTARIYRNGGTPVSRVSAAPSWPAEGLIIGDRSAGSRQFHGVIDEVRVSNIARSNAWITTEYNNQNDPSSFYSLGNQEQIQLGNQPPILFGENPTDGSVNVNINIPSIDVVIQDPEGQSFNWTITTSPNIGISSGTGSYNGTISCTISGLAYATIYTWTVNAYDGHKWTNKSYSFTTQNAPINNPPTVSSPNPANGSTGISVITSQLSSIILDSEGNPIDWTIETSPNIGSIACTGEGNGTKTCSISGLAYDKTYTWYVNVTDGAHWTNKTYHFTTSLNNVPIISAVYPNNQNATYNPRLTIKGNDFDNDSLTVIFKSNASGTWETLGTYHGGNKIYYHDSLGMDIKNKRYYWSASVFDGTIWINNTYRFTAQAFILKWSYSINATTTIGPSASDVDHDGIYEVFAIGIGKIICINGITGQVKWTYTYSGIGDHSQFEIGDLNNDGIEEVVVSTYSRTIALHANNGTIYWNVPVSSSNKNIIIADLDGNKYPYVFIASDDVYHGLNGTGRIRKLRGTDGTVLAETFAWRPCYGCLSLADLNNDGKFELIMNDRSYNYHAGEPGRGIQCYNADTLQLLWYEDIITCSSHSSTLVDVNNDGILDVVALQQSTNAGIYVIDGATWEKMSGHWQDSIGGLSAHSQPSTYDIDNDGNLELITCSGGPAMVWDLGRWSLDANLNSLLKEPPKMGNVLKDEKLEIIAAYNDVKIYNQSYQLKETITTPALAQTCVQDIDNNGRNELILMSETGIVKVYDTSGLAPAKLPRTNSEYYSERRTGAAVYIPPPGAPQPIIKQVSPVNGSQDVGFNPTLAARVIDFHYDLMNITISTNASGSWQNLTTFHNVGNGWYNYTATTMNQPHTTYYWRITATDPYADKKTTIQTFSFTTSTPPEPSAITAIPTEILPGNHVNITARVTDNNLVSTVKINISYPDGHSTNLTANNIAPGWQTLTYDDFESGFGNYTDGGTDCSRYTGGSTYAHQGNGAIKLQDYKGTNSSFYLTQGINGLTARYTKLKVDFWFKATSMEDLENFWVKYYDGQHWLIADNYIKPGYLGYLPGNKLFNNGNFYHAVTWINSTTFPFHKNMKIKFQCDASDDGDNVYIDQVYINATTAQGPNYYYNNTYTQRGLYHYYIWAKDNSGNSIRSDIHTFSVVSNTGTLTVNVSGNGTVTVSPSKPLYTFGEKVNLTAIPETGWSFSYWSGDLSGTTNPVQITMAGNKVITAHFAKNNYSLIVNIIGNGTVAKNPNKATYHFNDSVTLNATGDPDWSFTGWSGDLTGTTNPTTITITGNTAITVHFSQTLWLADWQYRTLITVNKQVENCRMYAAISNNLPNGMLQSDLITKTYSLKNLAATNNIDGWGIAYYSDYNQNLNIVRGAEKAYTDTDYDTTVSQINTLEPKITLAHIRKCTGGCCIHGAELIDDPHPFMKYKNGMKFTFMHNGGVNVALVKTLIGTQYLTQNPLNCSGVCGDDQNCDSEIYFTLLLKHIEGNNWNITKGIIEGINELVNAGESGAINFVLSDGQHIWAFRRGDSSHTLNYVYNGASGYSAVASQVPSGTQGDWIAMDNYDLVVLSPNENPRLYDVLDTNPDPTVDQPLDFPILIDMIDSDLAAKAQPDGHDILFTDFYLNKINYEIEYYNASSGHLVAWVNIPLLFIDQETDIYLYYGNENAVNQENHEGVWNSNYTIVQHLEETSGTITDSTHYKNNGTAQNGVLLDIIGKIDGADRFDGTNDYIVVPDASSLDGDGTWTEMTIDFWLKPGAAQRGKRILAKYYSSSANQRSYQIGFQSSTLLPANTLYCGIVIGSNSYQELQYNTPLNTGQWYHIAFTYKSGNRSKLYIDGMLVNQSAVLTGNIQGTPNIDLNIGRRQDQTSSYYNGDIDEIRISKIARSTEWIYTSYRNQNNPASFIEVGNEEKLSGFMSVLNEYPDDRSTNIPFNPILRIAAYNELGYPMNITWSSNATGSWTILGTNSSVINGTYYCGNAVAMNQYETTYYWRVNVDDGHGNTVNKTFSFTTISGPYILTLNITGNGVVTKNPDKPMYTYGTSVQLTTTPATNWLFAGWSGDISGNTTPTSITMNGNKTVTAIFTPIPSYDDVVFNSSFDQGNLIDVQFQSGNSSGYRFYTARNYYTTVSFADKHWWFYYSMENVDGKTVTVRIVNGTTADYSTDPSNGNRWPQIEPVYSYDNINWQRVAYANVSFDRTARTFTIKIRPTQNKIWIAPVPPYPVWKRDALFDEFASSPYLTVSSLGTTPGGQQLKVATITDPNYSNTSKFKAYVTAQQHAGEIPGSWNAEGMIRFLLSDNATAQAIRRSYIFKIIPIANPDGVYQGICRYTPLRSGVQYDLNREWNKAIGSMPPEVAWIYQDIQNWQPNCFNDMHSTINREQVSPEAALTYTWNTTNSEIVNYMNKVRDGGWPETVRYISNLAGGCFQNIHSRLGINKAISFENPHDELSTYPGVKLTVNDWMNWGAGYAKGVYLCFGNTTGTLTTNTVGSGSITKNPDYSSYVYGTTVQLTATPTSGWTFHHWSGDLTGTTNPATITITGNKTITANFAQKTYTLTINTQGQGSVVKNPDLTTYPSGQVVTLTANPSTGWSFDHWTGNLTGSTNPTTITMNENKTVIANFTQGQYTLTITPQGQGTVTKSPDQPTYSYGQIVQLSATANPHWAFNHWAGDLTGSVNPSPITMDNNKAVTANFSYVNTAPTQTTPLLVSEFGTNTTDEKLICRNQSTSDPNGDTVYNTYHWYKNGTSVVNLLLPFNTANSIKVKDYSGYTNNGTISGATWSSAGKIGGAYSFDGTNDYISIPHANSLGGGGTWSAITIEHWIYLTSDQTNRITIAKMSTSALQKRSYQIGINGTGTTPNRLFGAVIVGSNTYREAFNNTPILSGVWYHVALTYKSGVGLKLYLNGVQIATCSGTGNIQNSSGRDLLIGCRNGAALERFFNGKIDEVKIYPYALSSQQINQNYLDSKDGLSNISRIVKEETSNNDIWRCEITPTDSQLDGTTKTSNPLTIVIPQYTLTVNKLGNGGVVKLPDQSTYNQGTSVQLTATADLGWTFSGWSGNLTGTTNPATITMNGNKIVTATFTQNLYTLTLSKNGNGTTKKTPDQLLYHYNDIITINATADVGWTFTGWSGDLTSIANPTTVTINGNKNITATFTHITYRLTASAGIGGIITPLGITTVNYGTYQNFTITADTGYHILDVVVDSSSVGAVPYYNFTNVIADHTILASFEKNTYTITASASAGGFITPSGIIPVSYGDYKNFTITPNTGYHIVDVLVDSVSVGRVNWYNFTAINNDHTISVSFAIDQYTITASAGVGGSITPSGEISATHGEDVLFTITSNIGYHILNVVVDSVSQGNIATYTFSSVTANHTIFASFVINSYTIIASAGTGGTITPLGSIVVIYGGYQNFTITANTGYHINDVLLDSVSVGAVHWYNISNINTNHTITATFTVNTYTITATAGSGGTITPSGAVIVNYGSYKNFTIAPNTGYHTQNVIVDSISVGTVTYYNFTNIQANHTISASFAINQILVDSTFDASVDSADLRTNSTGQDWYESRAANPTALILNTTSIGGNAGKKAGLKYYTQTTNSVYLSQELNPPQNGIFNLSFDIFIDRIFDDSYDRTGYIYIGDDSNRVGGPCNTSIERFVLLVFYDSTPGETGNDIELRAREWNSHTSGPSQPWATASTWTLVKSGLGYDTWHNIKIKINVTTSKYDIYINGVLAKANIQKYEQYLASSPLKYVSFSAGNDARGDYYIDNVFSPAMNRYQLKTNVVGNGIIQKNPSEATYAPGSTVTLTATPTVGWHFSGWSGSLTGSENPTTITMDNNKTINATFTPDLYNLTIQIEGNGTVNKLPNQDTYYLNDNVQLTAISDTGWSFDHWAMDLTGNENPKNLLINSNKTVIANFSHVPGLQIDANFDSGSLGSSIISGNTVDLTLKSETLVNTGDQYTYWTYFKAINTLNRNITFRITNSNLVPFLYDKTRNAQMVYSYDGINWNRFTDHANISGVYTFWKNFTANEVQIATFFPFSYTTMQDYLDTVNASQWATKTMLGKSQQNRDISLLTITNPIIPNLTKKVIYIVGRQHASETASSHMLNGLIDFLLSDSLDAQRMRDNFVWYIVPMVNPDGVFLGNSRATSELRDPNRDWHPNNHESAEIDVVRADVVSKNTLYGIDFFIDWHNQVDELSWYNYIYYPSGDNFYQILSNWTDFDHSSAPGTTYTVASCSARGYGMTNLHDGPTFTFEPCPHLNTWTLDSLHEQGVKVAYAIDEYYPTLPLLTDSEFTTSSDSNDLIANATTQDWYESRNDQPSIISLDSNDVANNTGKKARFSDGHAKVAYLSQELRCPQNGRFNISLDMYIEMITAYYDETRNLNRTGFIFVGNDHDGSNGPCSTGSERFVYLTFYDPTPGDTGNDIELRAYETTASTSFYRTNEWTLVAKNLSYATWYSIKLDINFAAHTYHVYINDVCNETVNGFSGYNGSSLADISFSVGGTARGEFSVDNVFSPAASRHRLSVTTVGNGSLATTPGESTYIDGSSLQISAIAQPGWSFDHWTGDLSGSANPKTITITTDINATAVFTQNEYIITTHTIGTGTITITPFQSTYHYDTPVTIQTTPGSGWQFIHWAGNLSGHENPTSISITSSIDLTAYFSNTAVYTLTTNVIGNGVVNKNPDWAIYEPSTKVTLTPVGNNSGWTFNYWTGNISSGHEHDNPLTITMDANKSITAHFKSSEPTVLAAPVTNITSTSAKLQGYINNTGGENCSVWFEYDYANVEECMGIIATGTVCKDGRSIIQKNRHFYYDNVKVYYYQGTNYSFFGIGDSPPNYVPGQCRMGQNEKGLAINNMDVSGKITKWNKTKNPQTDFQTDWASGSQDHDSRFCLGNYSTVRDTAYYLAKHGYYYGNGSTNGQYLIISSEPGVGAIVAIDRVGHTKITWINNTYAGCANSWYCDGVWDTGDYNDKRAKIIMNDIVQNGTSSDGDHLLNWQDIAQRVAKDTSGREKGTGSYSFGGQIACGYSRSSVVSIAGNTSRNSSIHMSWVGIGRTTQVAIFLPLYAGNLHSTNDIPSYFTTANSGRGMQPYADVKQSYARGNLADGNFYCSRVREILKYTNYNENLTFNAFDNLMDTIMFSADQQEVRSRLDSFMDTYGQKALNGYLANTTKSSYDTFKNYPHGVGYFSQTVTGLKPGTMYYMKAWANNTGSTANASLLHFMTKPEASSTVQATRYGSNQVNLSWTKGSGAFYTVIERNATSASSWARGQGIQIYNGTGKQCVDTGVQSSVQYYYRLWSYTTEKGLQQYSTNSALGYTGANMPPAFSNINPADGATGVLTNITQLSLTIQDLEGNLFSWTIQTSPNIGSNSGSGGNGTKTCTVSGLNYGIPYKWYVNATDGTSSNNKTYTFTTKVGILLDPDFNASVNSTDLRNNGAGQDWYESRSDTPEGPTFLTLDTNTIGANSGKKAALKNYGSIAKNCYLTQELGSAQSGTFSVSFDINIDRIQDLSTNDRTGHIYIGNNKVTTDAPTGQAAERFVLLAFYDSTPTSDGDILIKARTLNDATAQPWGDTSKWITVTSGLSYDTWYTIKIIINFVAGTYDVYINNVWTGVTLNKMNVYNGDPISYISFVADSAARGDFYVDNVRSPAIN